jgi:hypothetical protein
MTRARNLPAKQEETVEDDPWSTGSGMPDKFIGYIDEPFFGVDEKYHADAMLFNATLVDEEGEPVATIKYSVGEDWEANNEGTEITHPTKTKVNSSSRFGRFIDRIAEPKTEKAPKRSDVLSPDGKTNGLGLKALLMARGVPTQANSFAGLGFFWEQHQMETMSNDDKGKPIIKNVLLPTEYVGTWEEKGANGAAAPAKASTTRPTAASTRRPTPAPAPAAEEAEDIEIPIPIRKKLTSMAQSSTVKEFIRAAAKDKDVIALPEDAMTYILGSGEKGFWASVQPE